MIVVFVVVMLAGFGGMVLASQRAVQSATDLVAGTNLPPFFVGITLLAIGTDLPEIANSIAASLTDHGDVNLGDSVGSAATQITLILGLLPILAGTLQVPVRGIISTGALTAAALALIAVLVSDGNIGRADALMLLAFWVAGSWVVYTRATHEQQLTIPEEAPPKLGLMARTFAALVVVAGSAMVSLWAIVGIADEFDAPEFLISFFVASLGTSLPELAFNVTALRRGAVALAIGGVVGASFVDSTLSVAIGPLIAPTDVTADLAVRGALVACVAVLATTLLMSRIKQHDWRTGMILIGFYGAFFVVLL